MLGLHYKRAVERVDTVDWRLVISVWGILVVAIVEGHFGPDEGPKLDGLERELERD